MAQDQRDGPKNDFSVTSCWSECERKIQLMLVFHFFPHLLQSYTKVSWVECITTPANFHQLFTKQKCSFSFFPRFFTLYASTCVQLYWTWLIFNVGECNLFNNATASFILGISQALTPQIPGYCINLLLRHWSGTIIHPTYLTRLFNAGKKMEKAYLTHFDWRWNVHFFLPFCLFSSAIFVPFTAKLSWALD